MKRQRELKSTHPTATAGERSLVCKKQPVLLHRCRGSSSASSTLGLLTSTFLHLFLGSKSTSTFSGSSTAEAFLSPPRPSRGLTATAPSRWMLSSCARTGLKRSRCVRWRHDISGGCPSADVNSEYTRESQTVLRCGGDNLTAQSGNPSSPLSITTFNVLAPIFKRVGNGRESEFRDTYLQRHADILNHLKDVGSDVICLQELWVAEQEMVDMYQRSLEGYRMYTLPRTEARGDGVACFVKDGIEVLDRQDLRLKGVGGRVALILRLGIRGKAGGRRREVVVANTHLLFPHARTFSILRIREVKKLLAFVECYTQTNDLAHLPVVLCGDFNGKTAGRVYQHLVERGFRCSYEEALGADADCNRWITHLNHLGEEVGVDYVWYRNPDPALGPMEPAWESIVYQSTKQQLLHAYPDAGTYRSSASEETDQSPSQSLEEAAAVVEAAAGFAPPVNGASPAGTGVVASAPMTKSDSERDRLSAACQLLGLSEGFELDGVVEALLGIRDRLQPISQDSHVLQHPIQFVKEQVDSIKGVIRGEEELKLLLDSSADDFDFLIPTIMDGSSTGLVGASGGATAHRSGGFGLETCSSKIWPPSLERGVWPAQYVISDHGSLTASFNVVDISLEDSARVGKARASGGGRSKAGAAAVTSGISEDGSPSWGSTRLDGEVAEVTEEGNEGRDWGAGDDGHYGLR